MSFAQKLYAVTTTLNYYSLLFILIVILENKYTYVSFFAVKTCAALRLPKNGALACDGWLHGIKCRMYCHKDFNLPLTGDGDFVCDTTVGKWDDSEVPDCTGSVN